MCQFRNILLLINILVTSTIFLNSCYQNKTTVSPKTIIPKVVSFNPDTSVYQELLDTEKDSVSFHSGFVTLLPNEAGEIHSTKSNEEIIITLSGYGKVVIIDGDALNIKFGSIAHIPANTKHQVANTSSTNLKYIYVTASKK